MRCPHLTGLSSSFQVLRLLLRQCVCCLHTVRFTQLLSIFTQPWDFFQQKIIQNMSKPRLGIIQKIMDLGLIYLLRKIKRFRVFSTSYTQFTYYLLKILLFEQTTPMHAGHNHSHGGGHNHSHGGGHQHHAGCSHGEQHHEEPAEYFAKLKQLKAKHPEFYWMEVCKGNVLAKHLQNVGLGFFNSINAQVLQGVVGMAHMMLTCEWMPHRARPFISGMFLPLFLYILLNYKILTGFTNDEQTAVGAPVQRSASELIIAVPIILYFLVAVRSSGSMKSPENAKLAKKIIEIRPYLENPNMMCRSCEMPRAFRSMHCPVCNHCTPKFTRHSLVFGICIGAANQLLTIAFFLSMAATSCYFIFKFAALHSLFGIITQIIMYLMNVSMLWMATAEFATLCVLNLWIGLTEFELQSWSMLQYLMNIPQREFINSCKTGPLHNLTQDVYALLGLPGAQAELYKNFSDNDERQKQLLTEQISTTNEALQFPQFKQGPQYIINWSRAYIYILPQMLNHPKRKEVSNMMRIDEPRMIENFRLMKKFKKQAQEENPGLNELQLQQKAMMKMQEHMVKNPPQMSAMRPPPEQQRVMQLQMLGHMKMSFKGDPEIFGDFEKIEAELKSNAITPDQAAVRIRDMQQKVMKKKMEIMLAHQKQQQAPQNQGVSNQTKIEDQPVQRRPVLSNQASMQAQMLQKLEERAKQASNSNALKRQATKTQQLQDEEDELKAQIVQDENL